MALKATYEIRCSCGTIFPGDVCEYVFAEHDPELKDAILSGEFNCIPCPSCDRRLDVETRFLYRDEKNRLWVWVCKKEEEPQRDAVSGELFEKDASMKFHFLDDRKSYRKFLVFGREELLALLLREDPVLRRREGRSLKTNPAFRVIREGTRDPGYLLLHGEKIRVFLPLRLPGAARRTAGGREGIRRWLEHFARGVNVHNPYSSLLDAKQREKWNRVREKEPRIDTGNEFDDFAESWAFFMTDRKRFLARYPGRGRFFEALRGRKVSRRIRSLDARRVFRKSA